ncbi:cupin domain-containing protein [Thermoactinomyces mirandus]|uniref:Cupin domain-containing protein n=1 Tax=Thermoactinomyces mirandus TaxID=2756294 RepID=A0A7W2ARC5_9BACL|nr:cupin domain-containing protein [Thermoactinomyces mirandus]MBA4601430.1 cupin domain-containing protein [Thermoactinomyces mirandus]
MNKSYIIRRDEQNSIQMGDGVYLTYLRKSADKYSVFVKMLPGGVFPVHEHAGGEEIFVVDGEVSYGQEKLYQGDYFYCSRGLSHSITTDKGCSLLISSVTELEAKTFSEQIQNRK